MVKIIGLGGIGSHLASPLCRHIDALEPAQQPAIALIDGDRYEARNASRQEFTDVGNKAEMTRARLRRDFPGLTIEAKPEYITEENAFILINSGDTVFLCVDNHATRKLVSDRCAQLADVLLISGGNELTDGNVQIYIRRDNRDLTPPITYLHPEIERPGDRNPAEMSCEELAKNGSPQLIFTNLTAAALMLSAYWMVTAQMQKGALPNYSEQYFDIATGNTKSFLRTRMN